MYYAFIAKGDTVAGIEWGVNQNGCTCDPKFLARFAGLFESWATKKSEEYRQTENNNSVFFVKKNLPSSGCKFSTVRKLRNFNLCILASLCIEKKIGHTIT